GHDTSIVAVLAEHRTPVALTSPSGAGRPRRVAWLGVPGSLVLAGLLAAWWGGWLPERHKAAPAEPGVEAEGPVLPPEATRHDFGLKVEMLGSERKSCGEHRLRAGQEVAFRIEVERDA